jgi:hypothetical protein
MQTFTGKQYLQIDIAGNFNSALDKISWDERLVWFEEHKDHLYDLLPQAEKPALYFAGLEAWEAVQRSEPIGYPISLDATASGLQILACLTGDRSAAEICNVVNTGNREDAYTHIWQTLQTKVGAAVQVTRQQAKDACVPAFYGSKAKPKEIFGEALLTKFEETMGELTPACWELNQAFLAIWDPDALSNDWVLPDNFHVKCKVMNQVTESVQFLNEPFDIHRKVNAPTKEGRSLGANVTHSLDGMIVREMVRRCSYEPSTVSRIRSLLDAMAEQRLDTSKIVSTANNAAQDDADARMVRILWDHYHASGYLSARILDHLKLSNILIVDPYVIRELIDSLPEKPFQIISVHDCFRCLPSYGNDLRAQYNRQLYEIARSNLLSFILSQLVGRTVKIGKLDSSLANDILDSDYALS